MPGIRANIGSLESSFMGFFSREAIGLAFLRAWSATFFSSAVSFGASSDYAGWGSVSHEASLVALIVAFLGIALLHKTPFFPKGRAFRWASIVMTQVGSACIIASIVITGTPNLVLGFGAVLTGVGSAMMTVSWGAAYAKMSREVVYATTLGSFVFFGLLMIPLNSGPELTMYLLALLSPLASAFCLKCSLPSEEPLSTEELPAAKADRPKMYRAVLYIALFNIVHGAVVASNRLNANTEDELRILAGLIIVAVSVFMFLVIGNLRMEALLVVLALVFASFLLLSPFEQQSKVVLLLEVIGISLARVVLWTYLVCSFASSRRSHYQYFGLGMGAYYGGLLIGGEVLAKTIFSAHTLDSVPDLFAFSLVNMFLLVLAYLVGTWTLKGVSGHPRTEDGVGDRAFDSKVASVARHYGLTAREEEILWYLARDYSSKSIESKLCISAPTVSTHSVSIYRKMDIHSKKQAGDIVHGWGASPGERDGV